MKSKDTKESLINEFFEIKGNYEVVKIDKLIRKLDEYISKNESYRELKYLLIVLKSVKEDYRSSNFELCKKIVMPMFEELNGIDDLSFFEIIFFASVIEFAPTFEQVKYCEQKITSLLETKYKQEKKYEMVQWMISKNMLSRLVRAKYPSVNTINTEGNRKEIQELFDRNLKIAKAICKKMGLLADLAMVEIREGVFSTDAELIDKGMNWLSKNERKNWYPSAVDELLTYYRHLGDEITKQQLDILIGYRIRKIREAQEIHVEEAAEFIGLTDNALEQIESGRRGAKNIHLYKLSQLFKVDISYFYYGEKESSQR